MRPALLALTLLTGCGRTIAAPEPCTMARAGADTASATVVGAAGDTTRVLVSVGWCVQ